jgi:hypothetical protein
MSFKGRWRNQYGSILEVTSEADGNVVGTFTTALEDSSFFGKSIAVRGRACGNVIVCASADMGTAGAAGVSYTGLLRDGRIEAMWITVADAALSASAEGQPATRKPTNAWRAFGTSLDIFDEEPVVAHSSQRAGRAA